jgi:hypothetical protein
MTLKPKQDDPEQSRRFIEIAEAQKATNSDALKEAVKKLAASRREPPKGKPPT